MSVTLSPPKKTPAGYFLAVATAVTTPTAVTIPVLTWDDGIWQITDEWSTWAIATREALLKELLAHPTWFSRPPRREVLDPLFSPWSGRNMQGTQQFFCKTPDTPGPAGSSGHAVWALDGLLMSATAIAPIWSIKSHEVDPQEDTISLFGDVLTADGEAEEDGETREIQLEDIEEAPPAPEPTRIRNREWEARKFLAKERVREARLKAQVAERLAEKEEARFYRMYGDLEDGESHFSEYDLTDSEAGSESEGSEDGGASQM